MSPTSVCEMFVLAFDGQWRIEMGEFLQNYGFFIVIAVLMLLCHLLHFGGHGDGEDDDTRRPSGGHQH